ncbi:MAG: NAD(P)/FAD-dependent oxidoreductase, partial [Chlorobi bacterium]|nr:NAD(P)/FAD-dependent oxidoreductase [Chlorobiota bacterium]
MKTDVLIIGAGPAGTIAAGILRKENFNVTIVEKQKFPRFVIGESLLPRCMDVFEEAGYLDILKKQGFQKKYGAVFLRGNEECTFNFDEQYTDGWSWTWQVPRDDFDKVLADEAENKGAKILYETSVKDIKFSKNSQIVEIEDKNGNKSNIEAKFVIDASGYGRVIPNILDLNAPSALPTRNSLFTQVIDVNRPEGESGNRITIIDSQPGVWIWIIPFSNGKTSVGFVASPEFYEKYSGSTEEKLRAMLADDNLAKERFKDVEFAFAPIYIEGYSIGIKKLYGEGFVLTGNATEFLDPVFSSGVTFAVESGMQAAKLVARQLNGENIDWDETYVKHIEQGVETFRTYVNAWYDNSLQTVFFAKNTVDKIKRQICSVLAGYVW